MTSFKDFSKLMGSSFLDCRLRSSMFLKDKSLELFFRTVPDNYELAFNVADDFAARLTQAYFGDSLTLHVDQFEDDNSFSIFSRIEDQNRDYFHVQLSINDSVIIVPQQQMLYSYSSKVLMKAYVGVLRNLR